MDTSLNYTKTVTLDATQSDVWDALTNPDIIRRYFFGIDVESDFTVGSPIFWHGVWEGKAFTEKGEILEVSEGESLSYSYLMGTYEDKPENYSVVTYRLETTDGGTDLTLVHTGFHDPKERDRMAANWNQVLDALRNEVERVVR